MMKFASLFLLSIIASSSHGQTINPIKIELGPYENEYLPIIRSYEESIDFSSTVVTRIPSPFLTMEIEVQEESDLTKITYANSFAKSVVFTGSEPLFTIEIHAYRSYDIHWLNEDLVQITNWPGRCLELHTIYSVLNRKVIYLEGFQHCGV